MFELRTRALRTDTVSVHKSGDPTWRVVWCISVEACQQTLLDITLRKCHAVKSKNFTDLFAQTPVHPECTMAGVATVLRPPTTTSYSAENVDRLLLPFRRWRLGRLFLDSDNPQKFHPCDELTNGGVWGQVTRDLAD